MPKETLHNKIIVPYFLRYFHCVVGYQYLGNATRNVTPKRAIWNICAFIVLSSSVY